MFRKIAYIVYQPYKWLFLIPYIFISSVIFGVFAVLFSTLINQRVGSFIGGVIWARCISLLTPMFVKISGKENIDYNQSYIITPNHQSLYDVFVIYGWIGLDIKWIMKKEIKKIPGVGFGSQKVGHIFLDRSNAVAAAKSLEKAKEILAKGSSVVMFPEGTRSDDGNLLSFKRGAFKLALELGLPILPVTINGTKNIMPGKAKFDIFPGKASIHIHKPIDIKEYNNESIKDLMTIVREKIKSKIVV